MSTTILLVMASALATPADNTRRPGWIVAVGEAHVTCSLVQCSHACRVSLQRAEVTSKGGDGGREGTNRQGSAMTASAIHSRWPAFGGSSGFTEY